jgi:hypothetical protein|tara:strand:- start:250 stop:504 length:255 start_codon:yes stop_codon:yes gene_type:complete
MVKRKLLELLVRTRRLTPGEKLASRIGYFGAGCLLSAHWTLEPRLYIAGFICILVQVASRKQWNLVVLNINGLVAWTKHLISNL